VVVLGLSSERWLVRQLQQPGLGWRVSETSQIDAFVCQLVLLLLLYRRRFQARVL
jgi:hypothetical protein